MRLYYNREIGKKKLKRLFLEPNKVYKQLVYKLVAVKI